MKYDLTFMRQVSAALAKATGQKLPEAGYFDSGLFLADPNSTQPKPADVDYVAEVPESVAYTPTLEEEDMAARYPDLVSLSGGISSASSVEQLVVTQQKSFMNLDTFQLTDLATLLYSKPGCRIPDKGLIELVKGFGHTVGGIYKLAWEHMPAHEPA
ncbi:MAG: hypothetical protein COY40_02020 [Alphaproteobacteria bacterium CG_4_10_14_0_8_um_filter_53_9]|nr:MAG: hypothetical protein COY40_02020 [Alphaproteobacteria bacterium CG_4_10_14_0_8_um_filter_53_9]